MNDQEQQRSVTKVINLVETKLPNLCTDKRSLTNIVDTEHFSDHQYVEGMNIKVSKCHRDDELALWVPLKKRLRR